MNEQEPRHNNRPPEASPPPAIDFESLPPFEKKVVEFTENYAHVSREQALLTPDLRKLMTMAKEGGWFMTQSYRESYSGSKDRGYSPTYYDHAQVHYLGPIPSIQLIPHGNIDHGDAHQEGMHEFVEYKTQHDIGESLTIRPLAANFPKNVEKTIQKKSFIGRTKEKKVIVTEYERKPLTMGHMFNGERFSDKEAVMLVYQASGVLDYRTNVADYLTFKWKPKIWVEGKNSNSDDDTKNLLDDLQYAATEIHKRPELMNNGRPTNQMTIALTIPIAIAEKVTTYFQRHPEHMRAFFVEGAANAGVMTMHTPPPYAKWDTEKPNRKILLRTFTTPDEGSDSYLVSE